MNGSLGELRHEWARQGWYWLPPILYAALIFYLSSQSHPETFMPGLFFLLSDKVIHAIEYGVLGVLCFRAFHYGGALPTRAATVLAVATAVLYGLTDEVHQAFVPLREMDAWDLVANTIGASAAVLTWRRITNA